MYININPLKKSKEEIIQNITSYWKDKKPQIWTTIYTSGSVEKWIQYSGSDNI